MEMVLIYLHMFLQIKLATNTVDVISWIPIDPNATGVWVPIDPNNP